MRYYHNRNGNSVLAEWILKITLIFFVASIFFSSSALEFAQENTVNAWGTVIYLKLAFLVLFIIVILTISQAILKIIGFSTIIVGSVFKILMAMSISTFVLVDSINLADSFLLIGVSVFYLYRHNRHTKKAKKLAKKKKPSA